jgi:AraC-like DNA-binding protein
LLSVFYATFVPYLIQSGLIIYLPHLYRTGTFAGLLIPPLIYLIAVTAMYNRPLTWLDSLHLLPLLFYMINFSPLFFLSSVEKVSLLKSQSVSSALYHYSEGWLVNGAFMGNIRILQILFYLVITLRQVIFFKYELDQWKEYDFAWKPVIMQLMLFFCLYLLPIMVDFSTWFNIPFQDTNQLIFAVSNMILVLFFLSNPEFLYGSRILEQTPKLQMVREGFSDPILPMVTENKKVEAVVENNNIRVRKRIDRIKSHLVSTKSYLSPEFSLVSLEKELGISGKLISQTIKEGTGLSFSSFINEMRIFYVLEMIQNDLNWKNFTVEALASSVGYRSPTSFYTNFKEKTGKTPREFIESVS